MNRVEKVALLLAAILVAVCLTVGTGGCGTWQESTAFGADTTRRLVELGNSTHRAHCDEVLQECIDLKQNPCTKMTKCNADRRTVAKLRVTALEAIGSSFDAIKAGNRSGADFALEVAQKVLGRIQSIVKTWQGGGK